MQQLGYEEPTEEQEEALMKFAAGKDVFISLPTGSGKSVCFASVSLLFDKIRRLKVPVEKTCSVTIVVSPLVALMQDQVSKFTSRGLIIKNYLSGSVITVFVSHGFHHTFVR